MGSWCRLNVFILLTSGIYEYSCPSHSDQGGYIFAEILNLNSTTIKICSNLGDSTGSTKYMESTNNYEE